MLPFMAKVFVIKPQIEVIDDDRSLCSIHERKLLFLDAALCQVVKQFSVELPVQVCQHKGGKMETHACFIKKRQAAVAVI